MSNYKGKLTPELEQNIVQRYTERGQSAKQIGMAVGLSDVTVLKALKKANVKMRAKGAVKGCHNPYKRTDEKIVREVYREDNHVHGVNQTAYYFNYALKYATKKELPAFKTLKEFTKFKRAKLIAQKDKK